MRTPRLERPRTLPRAHLPDAADPGQDAAVSQALRRLVGTRRAAPGDGRGGGELRGQWPRPEKQDSEDKEGTGGSAAGEGARRALPAESPARGGPYGAGVLGTQVPEHVAHVQGLAREESKFSHLVMESTHCPAQGP